MPYHRLLDQAMEKQRGGDGSAPPARHRPHLCRQVQLWHPSIDLLDEARLRNASKDLKEKIVLETIYGVNP